MKGFVAAALLCQVATSRRIHDAELGTMQENEALSLVQMRVDYSNLPDGSSPDEGYTDEGNTDEKRDCGVIWNVCNAKVTTTWGLVDVSGVDKTHVIGIRYHDVAKVNGKSLDLLLKTGDGSDGSYIAHDSNLNGRVGCFGRINIEAPGSVRIKFSLVEANTVKPVDPDLVGVQNFTIVDFGTRTEEGNFEPRVEQVVVGGFSNINETRLNYLVGPDTEGRYTFVADPESVPIRDPHHLLLDSLSEEELAGTVNLMFEKKSSWEVEFKATSSANGPGRSFLWAGKTGHCKVDLQCRCLKPTRRHDHHVTWDMCNSEVVKNSNGEFLRYRRIAKIADGKYADLLVRNLTELISHNESKNGKKGCVGRLNLEAKTNVKVKFTLVKEGESEPLPVNRAMPTTYDFNIFDFDEAPYGTMEVVGVGNYSGLDAKFMNLTEVDGITYLRPGVARDDHMDGTDLTKLTDGQIKATVSVSYSGTSEWTVEFEAENLYREGDYWTGGRNFFFSGESCASKSRHECSCPPGQTLEPPPTC